MTDQPKQNPNHFLDSILDITNLKNDAALSRASGISAPALSKLRHGRLPVTPATLLRFHDYTGLAIALLRELLYYNADNNQEAAVNENPVP